MRPKSMVLILIALACGLVASIGISQVVDKKSSQQETSQTAPVYVATVDVPIHEKLTAQSVSREEWPIERIPPGAITKLEEIDGRKPTSPLYKGEVILGARLVDPNSSIMTSTRIPKGYRVVSVKVQVDSAVSGLLSPGDRVDVLGYFRQNGQTSSTTKTILTDITVFAINDRISRRTTDDEEGTLEAKTVSLTVTPKQAQRLLLAAELGQIKLSLRNIEDDGDEVPEKTAYEDLAPSGSTGLFGGQPFTAPVQPKLPAFQQQPSGFQMELMSPAGTETYKFDDRSSLPTRTNEQSAGGAAFPNSFGTPPPASGGTDSGDDGFDFDSLNDGEKEESKPAEEVLQID